MRDGAIHIAGAGPAGLAAAITLAREGRPVIVHEARSGVGHRFRRDLQGLENWTTKGDALAVLSDLGIATGFERLPCRRGTVFDAWDKLYAVRSDESYRFEQQIVLGSSGARMLHTLVSLGPGFCQKLASEFHSHQMREEGTRMKTGGEKVKDPVCQMWVAPDQNAIRFQDMNFAFCSRQCKQRFLANPHLYVGVPREQAPKQAGQEVIKRRNLRLETPLSGADAQQVREHLLAMMGVYSVHIDANELVITYDLLQATAEQIEATLQQAGARLGEGWGERLRRAFVHYLEETEVASREVQPGPHGHGGHHHG
jgi:YHS domain-containing protein